MPKILSLYLDDSGTRNPDRKPNAGQFRDWFALGGIVINEEDEDFARARHERFCRNWGISYPLHSSEIRAMEGPFSWLRDLLPGQYAHFMQELGDTILGLPVYGHACVIDRPGYDSRYRAKYGRQTWMLCQTAFTVICERAAKFARADGRKLRVYPEASDRKADNYIRKYYADLRSVGMPFATATSTKYGPLTADQLKETLYDLKFKDKSSAMAQLADIYLYPIARGGYEKTYLPYRKIRECKKLIDDGLDPQLHESCGVKYSCFELVGVQKTQKPRSPSASGSPHNGDLTG